MAPQQLPETGTKIPADPNALLDRIIETLRGLRYGSVELVIHDGRVVQIERREKLRLDAPTHGR